MVINFCMDMQTMLIMQKASWKGIIWTYSIVGEIFNVCGNLAVISGCLVTNSQSAKEKKNSFSSLFAYAKCKDGGINNLRVCVCVKRTDMDHRIWRSRVHQQGHSQLLPLGRYHVTVCVCVCMRVHGCVLHDLHLQVRYCESLKCAFVYVYVWVGAHTFNGTRIAF